MAFTLDHIVPWGRSFAEYLRMFHLTEEDLGRSILGCGDGPASFNGAMAASGRPVVSVDPIYRFSAAQIEGRIAETRQEIVRQLEETREDYLWDDFAGPEELGRVRMAAMRQFLDDFPGGKRQGRYVAGELPALPFEDGRFELALCSHLLFLYSDHLSLAAHREALDELCRVASEVRIFPLVTLAGDRSPHVEEIVAHLAARGYRVSIEQVPYEFQRGGNEMMRILCAAGGPHSSTGL